MNSIFRKIANLCEIALLPGGLALKIRHRRFHWRDYRMCVRMRQSGVAPDMIFDVGANEGQFAIGALAAFPGARIHCFEPGGAARQRLGAEMQREPRVEIHGKALGRKQGEATLRVTSQDQSSSLLPLHTNHLSAYPEVRETRQEKVEVSTLEAMWEKLSPAGPVLLKIDTQGFEMDVLAGGELVLPHIRWIVLETCARPMYEGETLFPEIEKWLGDRGFSFMGPLEIHFTPDGRLCQFDALFEREATQQEAKRKS